MRADDAHRCGKKVTPECHEKRLNLLSSAGIHPPRIEALLATLMLVFLEAPLEGEVHQISVVDPWGVTTTLGTDVGVFDELFTLTVLVQVVDGRRDQ